MSGKRGSAFVWLAPLAAFAIGYGIAHVERRDTARTQRAVASTAPVTTVAASIAKSAAQRATARTSETDGLPPMPPDDTPLSESFDALAARARAGDVGASARLLEQTLRCKARARKERLLRTVAIPLADPDAERAERDRQAELDAQRKAAAFLARTDDLCSDVGDDRLGTIGEWLDRAAAGGDVGAGACYAATRERYAPRRFTDAWIAWMQTYQQRATADAERAFAAGWPQAAAPLFEAYAGRYAMRFDWSDPNAAPDYAKAYELALFESERLSPSGPDALDAMEWQLRVTLLAAELSPAQIASARAWVDATLARFDAAPPREHPCFGDDAP